MAGMIESPEEIKQNVTDAVDDLARDVCSERAKIRDASLLAEFDQAAKDAKKMLEEFGAAMSRMSEVLIKAAERSAKDAGFNGA